MQRTIYPLDSRGTDFLQKSLETVIPPNVIDEEWIVVGSIITFRSVCTCFAVELQKNAHYCPNLNVQFNLPVPEKILWDIKFLGYPTLGSTYLRGTMISNELHKLYPDLKQQPPSERDFDSIDSKGEPFRANLFIFIKPNRWMFNIPRENCRYIANDVLDVDIKNPQNLLGKFRGKTNIFITSSRKLEKELNSCEGNAVTIYDQQTNKFEQRIHGSNNEPVKTMAFMAGGSRNVPPKKILNKIGDISCSLGVQFYTICYHSVNRTTIVTTTEGYGDCSDPSNNSQIYSPYKIIPSTGSSSVEYPEQLGFQDIPIKVDVGLLLAPYDKKDYTW